MAPYDSDSSGDEGEDYTKTNVVLGFAATDSAEQVDVISHLGGTPQWIDPATPPSAKLARCQICHDMMVLLLQLNGDLPDVFPGHERRLYIFECRRKTCRRKEGSVRALRGGRVAEGTSKKKEAKRVEEKPKEISQPTGNIGATLFGANPSALSSGPINPFSSGNTNPFSNPFSASGSSSAAPSNPFAAAGLPASELASKPPQSSSSPTAELPQTFASALSLNSSSEQSSSPQTFGPPPPPEPWPEEASLPNAYPQYYLEDDVEYLDKIPEPAVPVQTMDLDEPGGSSAGGKEDKDVYESTIDKTFQKFADRLAQNPEQVIRYEFKGSPLLYSKSDAVGKLFASSAGEGKVRTTGASGIPKCRNCGARRVFEVQLTPHAIVELERDEEGLDGLEWGTVIVGVCEADCSEKGRKEGEAGYVEEWVGVQWEELKR